MADAALSKTQRRNARKRAKEKEKAGDAKSPPKTDAPLEPCYRQIFALSKEIIARRMALGGETPPDEDEWQQVWPLVPTIVHALHRTVQARRQFQDSGDRIADWELRWIGHTEFAGELDDENPIESPLSKGEAVPPSLGTAERPLGIRGSGRPLGGPSIPAAMHSGTASIELQACPDAVTSPAEHHDSSSGSDKLKGLWQQAQIQAESIALQAPGNVSQDEIHQVAVNIFRKLKKKDKSREKARSKRKGFGSKSSMVAGV